MTDDQDSKRSTPPPLVDLVTHVREKFDDECWAIDQTTNRLCYAAIHPGTEVENYRRYQLAFEQMKPAAGPSGVVEFRMLQQQKTLPALFAAHWRIRRELLESLGRAMFRDLFSLAIAQRAVLPSDPSLWAQEQSRPMLRSLVYGTKSWIRTACDTQPLDVNFEELDWPSWQAPLLIVMKPSRHTPYQAERVWERTDPKISGKWLDLFSQEVIRALEDYIRRIVGEIHLRDAKAGARMTEPLASSEAGVASSTFVPSSDYRSIRYKGEVHTTSRRQATILRLLYEARWSGHPDLSQQKLLAAVESETSAVRNIFRGSPLWTTLVRPGRRKGTYCLVLDED